MWEYGVAVDEQMVMGAAESCHNNKTLRRDRLTAEQWNLAMQNTDLAAAVAWTMNKRFMNLETTAAATTTTSSTRAALATRRRKTTTVRVTS